MTQAETPTGSTDTPGTLEEKGRELGRRADQVASRIQTGVHATTSRVTSALESTGTQVKEGYTAVRDRVAHDVHSGQQKLSDEVQTHPLRTLLVVFGAGALVGLLLARGSRRGS